jgi:hypothetical protein
MFRIISILWCLFLIVALAGLLVLSGQQVLATVPHSFNNLQNGYKLYEHIAWLSATGVENGVSNAASEEESSALSEALHLQTLYNQDCNDDTTVRNICTGADSSRCTTRDSCTSHSTCTDGSCTSYDLCTRSYYGRGMYTASLPDFEVQQNRWLVHLLGLCIIVSCFVGRRKR